MEYIYMPKTEEVIHVSEALAEFQRALYPDQLSKIVESDADIVDVMGFLGNDPEMDELMQSIDLAQHLSNPKDVPVSSFHPYKAQSQILFPNVPTKAYQFNCVNRALEASKSKAKRNKEVKLRYNRHKYVNKVLLSEPTDLVPFQEMLLIFRFYEPFKYKAGRRLGHPRFSQEFYVLGSQYLSELKDKILCNCDEGPFYEISEKQSQPKESNDQPPAKSGFFFIHDTFYNDLRDQLNYDYSSVIRKWAERQQTIGDLKSTRMENTRFADLKFRLGYPQVYQHQGNCEHVFVISDCRLLAPTDMLTKARYPFLNSYGFPRNVPCNICGNNEAQYIVRSSSRHIFDPAYICAICLNSYHYLEGEKIEEFELYKFIGTNLPVKDETAGGIDAQEK